MFASASAPGGVFRNHAGNKYSVRNKHLMGSLPSCLLAVPDKTSAINARPPGEHGYTSAMQGARSLRETG